MYIRPFEFDLMNVAQLPKYHNIFIFPDWVIFSACVIMDHINALSHG